MCLDKFLAQIMEAFALLSAVKNSGITADKSQAAFSS